MIERIGTHQGDGHRMSHLEKRLNGTCLVDCGSDCDGDEHVTRVDDEVAFVDVFMTDIGDADDCVADCES